MNLVYENDEKNEVFFVDVLICYNRSNVYKL